METILPPAVCFVLVLFFQAAHAGNRTVNITTPPNPGLNLTEFTTASTSFNITGTPTTLSNSTEVKAVYSSTKQDNKTFTTAAAATENTSQHQTSQSAAILTSPTDSGSLNASTTVQSSTLTVTTQTIQTTTHFNSTSDTPGSSTAHSSPSITTDSVNATEGLRLNISERNMTIIFSGMLGLFALALVLIVFHKCKHKYQYLHQPLTNTDNTDGFVADEDTLVISGGLYDGHPIYDNVPPTPAEQSQFRLQLLN